MFRLLADWSNRRRTVRELSRLSDHSLADLGISRLDINAVADDCLMRTPNDVASGITGPGRFDPNETMGPAWGAAQRPASLAA